MKSIITHFYNEEYLLPWWLEHHKKIFDYGLMINYNSTDRSVEIIKDICPEWQIVDSVNPEFSAIEVDKEVMYYEEQIPGWKICLNVPEFLYGDFSSLGDDQNHLHLAPSLYFVDSQDSSEPDKNKPLHEQYSFGCSYKDRNLDLSSIFERGMRCLHNYPVLNYPIGRHFHDYTHVSEDFMIFYYGLAPMNENLIKRKTQIQHKISQSDKDRNFGGHHITDEEKIFKLLNDEFRPLSKDLSTEMEKYVKFCY